MSTVAVHVVTGRWMTPVENVDKLEALYFGDVKDDPNLLAVVIRPGGGTRFFCQKHKRIFHPVSTCIDCDQSEVLDQPAA